MRPYAKYTFEKIPEVATWFILRKHSGADVPNFPAVWRQKVHRYYGEKYIGFRLTDHGLLGQRFTHCFCLEDNRRITFFNFKRQFPKEFNWDA